MFELTIWIIIGIIGTVIAAVRGGRVFKWLIIGVVCGPFALIHIVLSGVRCPACNKWVSPDATMCPSCHLKMPQREKKVNVAKIIIELALFAAVIGVICFLYYKGYITIFDTIRKAIGV